MQVRLTGLKPATRYYYRISTDRIQYKGGYSMKRLGTETDGKIRSFVTLGAAGGSKFCVINDTHKRIGPLNMVLDKVAEINPLCVVWNGDACTVEEDIASVTSVFLSPEVDRKDFASSIPYILCPGNHEQRGLGARRLEDVFMFRQPEERSSRDWDLGRNFAVRLGDVALVGLDTGEDRPDTASVAAGLFNNAAYREARVDWLRDALRRDDIASAPFLVGMCHIPLYSASLKKDETSRYAWQRQCGELWGPILDEGGCQLMISGHTHRFSHCERVPGHKWGQLTGGGPELCHRFDRVLKKQVKDERRFPTVIEGNVEDNRLFFTVHNVYRKQIVKRFSLAARKIATMAMVLVLAGLSQVASAKPSFILPEMANARKLVGELRKAAPDALIALPTRFSDSADQSAYGKGYGCRSRNALHPTLEGGAQLGDAAAAWLMYILGAK
jgi:UDP-2,3-diacylglucosamine pyrophosphatase LpxH